MGLKGPFLSYLGVLFSGLYSISYQFWYERENKFFILFISYIMLFTCSLNFGCFIVEIYEKF